LREMEAKEQNNNDKILKKLDKIEKKIDDFVKINKDETLKSKSYAVSSMGFTLILVSLTIMISYEFVSEATSIAVLVFLIIFGLILQAFPDHFIKKEE